MAPHALVVLGVQPREVLRPRLHEAARAAPLALSEPVGFEERHVFVQLAQALRGRVVDFGAATCTAGSIDRATGNQTDMQASKQDRAQTNKQVKTRMSISKRKRVRFVSC